MKTRNTKSNPLMRVFFFALQLPVLLSLACAISYPWERSAASAQTAMMRRELVLAEQLAVEALSQASALQNDDPRRLALLELKSEVVRLSGRPDEAAEILEGILVIREASAGEASPTLAPTLLALAVVALEHEDPQRAIQRLDRLLEIDERTGEVAASIVGRACGERALALERMSRFQEAYEDYKEAARVLGRSGPMTQYHRYQRAHVRLLRERGLNGKAVGIEEGFRLPGGHYLWDVLVKDARPHFRSVRYVTRWRRSQMPLRVCIPLPPDDAFPASENVVDTISKAVLVWENTVEPGLPSFEFVAQGEDCDIPFRWFHRLERAEVLAQVQRDVSPTGGDFRVRSVDMATKRAVGIGAPLDVLASTVTHEMGHALGLYGHSSSPIDVMYPYLHEIALELSQSDLETLRQIYRREPGTLIECVPTSSGCELKD
jgi:hypothetical protein